MLEAQLAAYEVLVAAARKKTGADEAAFDAFEPLFFGNLVLVLDNFFVHRMRGLEKKDGNSLNEVRMLCNSILQNDGVLAANKTIKFDSSKSVFEIEAKFT